MVRARGRVSAAGIALAFLVSSTLTTSASAHVKWFCAYNVAGQPDRLRNVLTPDFGLLMGLSLVALLAGTLLEFTPIGTSLFYALDWITRYLRDNIETIFRTSCAFFFIAIWAVGGILLTPELKTGWAAVSVIQLGIAAGMLSRRTMPLSALGIVILYVIGMWEYGSFHLADYPVFLGVAAYLASVGMQSTLFGVRPIDVLRWMAGITLMWASIEKWAYSEWSYPLLVLQR